MRNGASVEADLKSAPQQCQVLPEIGAILVCTFEKTEAGKTLKFSQCYSILEIYPNDFLFGDTMRTISAAAAALLCLTGPLIAQSLDTSDIMERFQAQRDAFSGATENGPTRNLILMTVDDLDVEAQVDSPTLGMPQASTELQPMTPAPLDDTQTTAITGLNPPTAPNAENAPQIASANPPVATYGKLAEELQVNLFINFAFDSAAIGADQTQILDEMCVVMRDSDIKVFQIVGHTDSAGSDAYNERLSRLRAEEVGRYLTASCGIQSNRLTTLGLGERFPHNTENTRADENRRVEFQALS
ncbi:OmpA family protein [uncultured Tateyamaria sp.]|uniref:OmpA family protein n=1 Tax=uncultured Tateyamaria sp. TaxID=455651 RepID=UPI0026249DC3|nr:OmpA family protein [uncultured Tateyamaria sp.]